MSEQKEMFFGESYRARCAHCGKEDVATCIDPRWCPEKIAHIEQVASLPDHKTEKDLNIFDERTTD